MLWNYFKHLKNKAPIYKDVMDEDENSIPQAYVVLEEGTYDEGLVSGDGLSILRRSQFNIRIHTRTKKKADDLVADYRNVLLQNGIQFTQFGPTFDPGTSLYSTLIMGSVPYGI